MVDLIKEITELNEKLKRYIVNLENAISTEEKIKYGGLIKSKSDNLTELLEQQTELNKGKLFRWLFSFIIDPN